MRMVGHLCNSFLLLLVRRYRVVMPWPGELRKGGMVSQLAVVMVGAHLASAIRMVPRGLVIAFQQLPSLCSI